MTDRLHLWPRHLEEIKALLRNHLPDVEVWAYGSLRRQILEHLRIRFFAIVFSPAM